jgi:hypothetical protein
MNTTSVLVCTSLVGALLPACVLAQSDEALANRATVHIYLRQPGSEPMPALRAAPWLGHAGAVPNTNAAAQNSFGGQTPDPLQAGPKIDIHF